MIRSAHVLLVLALVGCNETGLTGITEDETPHTDEVVAVPELVVSPGELTFAPLARGEEASASVDLTNVGDAELVLDEVYLAQDPGDFRLDLPVDWTLEPGQTETVGVRLRPLSADDPLDTLRIRSNDPDRSQVDVPLSGAVLLPELRVEPPSFDFGDLAVHSEGRVEVVVTNIGEADAQLSTSSYVGSSEDLYLAADLDEPVVLAPTDSHTFDVVFAPSVSGAVEGTLYVSTDVPGQTQVAAFQEGRGIGNVRPALIGIDTAGELREIDPSSGASTLLARVSPVDAHGLSFDPSTSTIWILSGTDGGVQLRTLDPCTGATTLVHRLTFPTTQGNRPEGFSVAEDGSRIWVAWGAGTYDSDELGWIDPATGRITKVGDVAGTIQGEVDHIELVGSTLYGRDSDSRNPSELYELDMSSGRGRRIGTMGLVHPGGMATDPVTGLSYVTDTDGSLFLADYGTGRTTRIGGGAGRAFRDFDFVELDCD